MKTLNLNLKILLLTVILLTVGSGCYGSRGTAEDVNLPGDPYLVVETLTPTPDPLIAGTLHIHRELQITAGVGGSLEVSGDIPLLLLYRDSAYAGDDLVDTQSTGTGISVMLGEGPVGTGDITGIWDVTFKVRGILYPAPKCDVELWVEEYWGDEVQVTMTVNGEKVISTMSRTDVITMVDEDQGSGHLIIPKGQKELLEYVAVGGDNWINTYKIELYPLTKFEGCFD